VTAVAIRPATLAGAADVAAMVREIAAREDQIAQGHIDDRWRSLKTSTSAPGTATPGVGRRLMAAFSELAAPDQLLVRCGVEPDDVDAQRFYRRPRARSSGPRSWRPGSPPCTPAALPALPEPDPSTRGAPYDHLAAADLPADVDKPVRPRVIGMLGGMSRKSTIEYYRLANELVRERLGGLHSAGLVLT